MKTPEEIQDQVQDLQSKLHQIHAELTTTKTDLDQHKERHAELVVQHLGKHYQPKSVTTSHRRLKQLESKIENLENARIKYEGRLESKQNELALVNLHESEGQAYLDQLGRFMDTIGKLRTQALSVRDNIEALNEMAAGFFEAPLMPTRLLENLAVSPLLETLSLEDFLQGKTRKTENSENASFVEQQSETIKGMVADVAVIGQELLDQFSWWCSVLVQFSRNPSSIERRSYVPPDRRPQQAITTQTIVNVPRHLRPGYEAERKIIEVLSGYAKGQH